MKLHPMAEALEQAMNAVAASDAGITEARQTMDFHEAECRIAICAMTGPDGKPTYSNDKARDAATRLATLENEHWRTANNVLIDALLMKAQEMAKAEGLKWTMRLMCAGKDDE